jgi:hypothetical protein
MIMPNNNPIDSATEKPSNGLVFDDEQIESLLYGKPGSGPTSASIYATAQNAVALVRQALERADIAEALHLIADFLKGDDPMTEDALSLFVHVARENIPQVPCPIVKDYGVAYEAILEPIFAFSKEHKMGAMLETAATPLYRWYEATGRYQEAARVISVLLELAKQQGNRADEAVFTNNHGYEYLLAADWLTAEPYFVGAAALFNQLGYRTDLANAHVNQLLCRYELNGCEVYDGLEAELQDILNVLKYDWRRRKPLLLMARIAERRGVLGKAIDLAREAVKASIDVPTLLHVQDQAYLNKLEAMLPDSEKQENAELLNGSLEDRVGLYDAIHNGLTRENAVVIDAKSTIAGVCAEYQWIDLHYGKAEEDWKFKGQCVCHDETGPYDIFDIELKDGSERRIYFDIGSFFGLL